MYHTFVYAEHTQNYDYICTQILEELFHQSDSVFHAQSQCYHEIMSTEVAFYNTCIMMIWFLCECAKNCKQS